ncbi:MAG: CDP-glycerol glycerophosphotransferase family protein [Candidatus Omnitrophota bacterium]|jgi:CDP-glycerol glycerophosphotransferase (TagB/SpsB family)
MKKVPLFAGTRHFLKTLLTWLTIIPLSCLIPKQRNLILVIGRRDGSFTENSKYFYLYLQQIKEISLETWFVTGVISVYEGLQSHHLPVLYRFTWRTKWKMLRAHIVIVDSLEWIRDYCFLHRAFKVLLPHGAAPLKFAELENPAEIRRRNHWFVKFLDFIQGRFPKYDLVAINHIRHRDQVIREYNSKNVFVLGSPRNDMLICPGFFGCEDLQTDTKVLQSMKYHKGQGIKVIFYAPTFRDSGRNILDSPFFDFDRFNDFLKKYGLVLIIAPHPYSASSPSFERFSNIMIHNPLYDIYPLLKYTDVLITDYSSLCLDYLFADKPIIFYHADYDIYLKKDRPLRPGFFESPPGYKCMSQKELEIALVTILIEGEDVFRQNRLKASNDIFFYKDSRSCQRVFEKIRENASL